MELCELAEMKSSRHSGNPARDARDRPVGHRLTPIVHAIEHHEAPICLSVFAERNGTKLTKKGSADRV